MIAAIRSEWIKLTTVTAPWVLAIVAAAFPLVVSLLTAAASENITGETLAGVVVGTTVVSGLLFGVVAALGITSEFSTQTIRPTFAAMPDRWRPLTAKPIVYVGCALVLSVAIVVVCWFGGRVIAGDSTSEDLQNTGAALIGVVVLSVGLTLLGYGLGLLLRNTALAICMLLLWPLVVESLIGGLLASIGGDATGKWLPYRAGFSMVIVDPTGEEMLGRVAGGVYFFAWVVAILVFGLLRTKRRDA